MGVMSTNWWGFPPWSIMSIYGKQISLGPGAGDHPIYHHRNLLFFRGKPSSPSFFINQPMGIWDMTISFGNFNGSDAKLDVQENPLVESWKGFFPTCQVRVVRFYVSWSALRIKVFPAGPQTQRISEDIPGRMPDRMSENMSNKCHLVRPLEESNFSIQQAVGEW